MEMRTGSIRIDPSKRGSLRKILDTPKGKNIPVKKLEKAKHSKNPAVRKKANFALAAKKFKH